jgi:long-chain acyl-CoA synthetase
VRRWAVLENDLSVAGGDLTPNLKLKRARVADRYGSTLDGLYAAREAPAPRKVART